MNLKSEILNCTTPICKFQFAWLVEPDTKFDPMGEWRITCLIDPEESQEIEQQLTGLLDRWKAQLKTAQPSKKFKLAALPWGFEEVTDGGETKGYFKIKAKMKVGGNRPDGTQWKNRPPTLLDYCRLLVCKFVSIGCLASCQTSCVKEVPISPEPPGGHPGVCEHGT